MRAVAGSSSAPGRRRSVGQNEDVMKITLAQTSYVPRSLKLAVGILLTLLLVNAPALADDLMDLLSRGQVQVEATGTNIQNVTVRIRRVATQPLQVDIPAGTFFASGSKSSAQDMISTSSSSISLTGPEWVELVIPAACADRFQKIPTSADQFTVRRLPPQAELAVAARALAAAGATYAVIQAGIWIVSDNADYGDLGELIDIGMRVINENAAAQAMQILSSAGINIKNKAIWADREQIAAGTNDSALADWLRSDK